MKLCYWGVATVLAWLCLVLVCDTKPLNHLNWLKIFSHRMKRQVPHTSTANTQQASTTYNSYPPTESTQQASTSNNPYPPTASTQQTTTTYNPWLNLTTGASTVTPWNHRTTSPYTSYPTTNGPAFSNSSASPLLGCSQNLTGVTGRFSSPGAGSSYTSNLDCIYTIPSPPAGSQIEIIFESFYLEDHASCGYDFVSFSYNGQKICGQKNTPLSYTFVSQERDFQMIFHSDGSVQYPGFYGYFRIQERPSWTPGVSTGTPWYYRTTTSHTLYPPTEGTQQASTTYNPWLNWTTGASTVTPWNHRTTSPYTSYPTTNGPAFSNSSASPNLVSCNRTYTADEGIIESTPGNGSYYPNNAYCTYTVQGNSTQQTLQFTVQTFSLEYHSSCYYDSLQFGSTSGRKYCGSTLATGRVLTYTFTNTFTLHFKTDSSVTRRGFLINYRRAPYVATTTTTTTTTTTSPSPIPNCNATFTATRGQLRSPNSPRNYPNNIYCRYTFVGSGQTQSISLDFTSFAVERHSTCRYDWVIVNGGNKRCGFTEFTRTYTFTGNFTVEFRTDGSVTYSGFVADYVVSDAPNATTPAPSSTATCTATLSAPSGTIMSPPGGGSNYLDNTRCYYTFTATSYPRTITFTFTTFQLESHPTCNYDYLQFNSGIKKCGTISNLVHIDTMNGQYRVTFSTDGSITRRGFVATYQITDVITAASTAIPSTVLSNNGVCGTTLTSSTGRIYYPTTVSYGNNVRCQVTIRPGAGQTFNVTFTDFDIENHSSCSYDSLMFRVNGIDSLKYCGRNRAGLTLSFTYTSGDIVVIFRSDGSVIGRGFDFNFQVA